MTLEQIEKLVGKKLTKDTCSPIEEDKKIYGGYVYFYARELKADHYFYIPVYGAKKEYIGGTLYLIKFDPNHTNPSITETGMKPDSFKMKFDDYLSEGKIEEIPMEVFDREEQGYKPSDNLKKHISETWVNNKLNPDVLIGKIDKIIIELTDLKAELRK